MNAHPRYTPDTYNEGISHLREMLGDFEIMYTALGHLDYAVSKLDFASFVRIIAGQQLSTNVANKIFSRIEQLTKGKQLTAKAIITCDAQDLLATGLSKSKAAYIKEIAYKIDTGVFNITGIGALDRDECYKRLISLRGIGPWSASIMMMFRLGYLNEFPKDDVTLLKVINNHFPSLKESILTNRAVPYRSIVALYLWEYHDQILTR